MFSYRFGKQKDFLVNVKKKPSNLFTLEKIAIYEFKLRRALHYY